MLRSLLYRFKEQNTQRNLVLMYHRITNADLETGMEKYYVWVIKLVEFKI